MFWLLGWLIYGLLVGFIAKAIHRGPDPVGFLSTLTIGVAGSFIGGGLQWLLFMGGPFSPAGLLWSVLGGVIFCWVYRKYRLNIFRAQQMKAQQTKTQNS